MKKLSFLFLSIISTIVIAQNKVECTQWKASEVQQLFEPALADQNSVDDRPFKVASLLTDTQIDTETGTKEWSSLSVESDSTVAPINKANQLIRLSGYISTDRYTKATLHLTTNSLFEVYLDGQKIKTQSNVSKNEIKTNLTLNTGKHQLLVKLLSRDTTLQLAAHISAKEADLQWSLDEQRNITIKDVLNGEYVQGIQVSPSGKYLLIKEAEVLDGSGKRQSTTRIYDVSKQKTLQTFRNGDLSGAQWLPVSDKISFVVRKDNTSDLYIYNMSNREERLVASDIKDLGSLTWSPKEDFAIFSHTEQADKPGDLKRIFGNDDRLPYFRSRSFLYMLNIHNGTVKCLTSGYLSTSLHDIKPDGSRILFSTSSRDYTVVPFSKQTLYEMDVNTFKLDTIWADKLYGGSCQYSPDGTQLLVSGSPEVFGDLGVNVTTDHLPNTYDIQLYLFDLKTKEPKALTREFDPSVKKAIWGPDKAIYLTAEDKDRVNLFRYDLTKKEFKSYQLPVDVISRIDFANLSLSAAFKGTSISTPEKLFTLDLKKGTYKEIAYPKEETFANITFGQTESWDFTNKNGTTITGYTYYPLNYDPSKKYPLIVYYYGGTSPVSRTFDGGYPKNIWAANGYMVYVLQPSGATGFGQDFSSLHVNGWGLDAIEDIIDGTKQFLAAHPSADADNVGCIGASYGGFTTMTLQTRTDIFKTAISHAGISDISSYWGEGYWGYSYSSTASRNSYPWNRKDIYVENSPLFNADKFQNSILLLHGTADTNVPVGESLQFYAALKILNKNVEMVLIDGEDHHITNYKKRIKWHYTIMSWFDKMLKNQPNQWKDMYPDKNL